MRISEIIVEDEKKLHGAAKRGIDAIKPTDWTKIKDKIDYILKQPYRYFLEMEKQYQYVVGVTVDGRFERNTLRPINMKNFVKDNDGLSPKESDIIDSYEDNYLDIFDETEKHNPDSKVKIQIYTPTVDNKKAGRFDFDVGTDGTLLNPNETPTEQDYIKRLVQLTKNDLERFQQNTWTVNSIGEIFNDHSEKDKKFRQSQLLSKIMSTFTRYPGMASRIYPLTVVDDIKRLNNRREGKGKNVNYMISAFNSIAVDFGEVIAPVALLTGNTSGNGSRVLTQFLGANGIQDLINGGGDNRPATIHFTGESNTQLYDSFIEYNGRVIAISSKGNTPGGASVAGLSKAIAEVKNNQKAAEKFNKEILGNEANKEMYYKLVELIDDGLGDSDDYESSSSETPQRKQQQLLRLERDLNHLKSTVGNQRKYSQQAVSSDYEYLTNKLSNSTVTRLNNDSTLYAGLSPYLKSKVNNVPEGKYWSGLMSAIITEYAESLNSNPLFSKICTWLLNHSAMVQVDVKFGSYYKNKPMTEDENVASDSRVPFQIYNIVATWPSTNVERVELIKDTGRYQFKLGINGYKESFGDNTNSYGMTDYTGPSNDQRDIEQWNKNFQPQNSDYYISPEDWFKAGIFTSKITVDPDVVGTRRSNQQLMNISENAVAYFATKYSTTLIPKMLQQYANTDFNALNRAQSKQLSSKFLTDLKSSLLDDMSQTAYQAAGKTVDDTRINKAPYIKYMSGLLDKFSTRIIQKLANDILFMYRGVKINSPVKNAILSNSLTKDSIPQLKVLLTGTANNERGQQNNPTSSVGNDLTPVQESRIPTTKDKYPTTVKDYLMKSAEFMHRAPKSTPQTVAESVEEYTGDPFKAIPKNRGVNSVAQSKPRTTIAQTLLQLESKYTPVLEARAKRIADEDAESDRLLKQMVRGDDDRSHTKPHHNTVKPVKPQQPNPYDEVDYKNPFKKERELQPQRDTQKAQKPTNEPVDTSKQPSKKDEKKKPKKPHYLSVEPFKQVAGKMGEDLYAVSDYEYQYENMISKISPDRATAPRSDDEPVMLNRVLRRVIQNLGTEMNRTYEFRDFLEQNRENFWHGGSIHAVILNDKTGQVFFFVADPGSDFSTLVSSGFVSVQKRTPHNVNSNGLTSEQDRILDELKAIGDQYVKYGRRTIDTGYKHGYSEAVELRRQLLNTLGLGEGYAPPLDRDQRDIDAEREHKRKKAAKEPGHTDKTPATV